MKNTTKLPEGYEEIYKIDLKNDKKKAMFIHITVFVIAILMIIIGMIFVPITTFFDYPVFLFIKFLVIIVGLILCIVLQNLLSILILKCFAKTKTNIGLSNGFSYVGSDIYFNKKSYIATGFAPMIIIIALFLIINVIAGIGWFWCIYIIQVYCISSSFSHIYVTYKLSKLPKDILIKDDGLSMTVYSNTHN